MIPGITKRAIFFVLQTTLLGSICGCIKSDAPPHKAADSTLLSDGDILYVVSDTAVQKIDAGKSSTIWSYPAGGGNMDYNFKNIFLVGLSTVVAVNDKTGLMNWMNVIPFEAGTSGVVDYRATAYQDSLIFYTKPTGVFYGGAQLYCAYQDNGRVLWSNLLDSNQYIVIPPPFYGIPCVVDGKVITLTRGYYGDLQISAFNGATGALIWNSPQNNSLSAELHVTSDYIYCVTNSTAYSYSTKDGSLLWQTDLQLPPVSQTASPTYTFSDNNLLIVCRNYNGTANLVREINATTGSFISNIELDAPEAYGFWGYGYRNNTLYTVNLISWGPNNTDSNDVVAFDLATQIPKWKYRYTLGSGLNIVVSDKFVIFPAGTADNTGVHVSMTLLDLNGNYVKSVPYSGTVANGFMYVNSSGELIRPPRY